jgi:hypothetical protein
MIGSNFPTWDGELKRLVNSERPWRIEIILISEILYWNNEPTERDRSDLQLDLPSAPFSDDPTNLANAFIRRGSVKHFWNLNGSEGQPSGLYWAARGIDERPVRADRMRKSVGAENTFPADLFTYEAARDALREIVDKVWEYCESSGIRGRTLTLKVKFANFQQITRSRTGQMRIRTRSELEQLGNALLEPLFPVAKGVRLLGISLSSLAAEEAERELELSPPQSPARR